MTGKSRIAFWAAAVFSLVMALLPQPPQLPGDLTDKMQHAVAFAVLAGLATASFPSTPAFTILIGLSAFGAMIEALQAIPALGRDGDPLDWVADTIAAAAVICVFRCRRSLWQAGSDEPS